MNNLLIHNAKLLTPGQEIHSGSVLIRDHQISALNPPPQIASSATQSIDAKGMLLTPGLIDLHTHGIHRHLYEQSPDDIIKSAAILPRYGTTCILPTLYRTLNRDKLTHLASLAESLTEIHGTSMPGFHLEGPFLKLPGAGGRTVPGDVGLLKELLDACKNRVTAMSVSPDTENINPVVDLLREREIHIFITHTQASASESEDVIARGARHGTHFYNVFPIPLESEPGCRAVGAVEALLADPECTVDFICDRVHVPALAIRAALAAKGPERVAAITDSNIGAGLPPGIYESECKYPVRITSEGVGRVYLPGDPRHDWLAGSSLTMDLAVNNLIHWLGLKPEDAFAMATSTPAHIAGLSSKGLLAPGMDADLVMWSRDSVGTFHVEHTWSMGIEVYRRNLTG